MKSPNILKGEGFAQINHILCTLPCRLVSGAYIHVVILSAYRQSCRVLYAMRSVGEFMQIN
jgi:hypothetical protein